MDVLFRRTTPPRLPDPSPFLRATDDLRRFPAAMLAMLADERHPDRGRATEVLAEDHRLARFFAAQTDAIGAEVATTADRLPELRRALAVAADEVGRAGDGAASFEAVWRVLFPEGVALGDDWDGAVERLRQRRSLEITASNPAPIVDPIREVLFTSNVLVAPINSNQPAAYWYDHPIPLDARPEETELAYGLSQLNEAIGFELDRHPAWRGPLTVVLSVSATHTGYEQAGRELVARVVTALSPLPHLRVFAFDESLTTQLWEVLVGDPSGDPVFGVSGLYGRHYSFLKAIAALWSVARDDRVRATFKIDLDQVFPQRELVAETGRSALENLTTPRWGATAVSSSGEVVDLAMIAGGLVNQQDIDRSLFTPDVTAPPPGSSAEHTVFYSRLPQALSTEAEITVGDTAAPLERIHVTGGTNGILVSGLRKWRLFTPSVFGRAEDQAYLISGLGGAGRPAYVHAPGLIMRHDKANLIPEIIRRSESAKHVGDLVRTRLFSSYGAAHKALLDPFTGSFVSRLPQTVSGLRFAVKALEYERPDTAAGYLAEGARRLENADRLVSQLSDVVAGERHQWDRFYDAIDDLESGLGSQSEAANERAARIRAILDTAKVGD